MQIWNMFPYNNVGHRECRDTDSKYQGAQWEYQKLLYDHRQQSQQQFQSQEKQKGPCIVNTVDMYGKVMTDEQLEILRKQIAVYGVVCEQLERKVMELAPQDLQAIRLGKLYGHSSMTTTGSRMISRQRWQPTVEQVQILEAIFDRGTCTPTRENVKEITEKLKFHGEVKEANVYNWFQNRRARLKRKRKTQPNINNYQQRQVDTTENKSSTIFSIFNNRKSLDLQPQPQPHDESAKMCTEHCFQHPNESADMHYLGSHMNEEVPFPW